ncbi:Mu transposase domain-containing protein [Streptomyces sp. NPDC050287]|uniref:Mu transposase domain-containing protein n=1 Tax=Streptomyces sp. NPDC050287 TaxID=3365608 RepID=UPI003799D8E2
MTAPEKGGVEGEVGRFRRNHLVPVPDVTTLAELNARIDVWDQQDDQRRIGERPRTVGEYFAIEKPLLQPLPEDHFETGRLLTPRVDRYAQITARMNRYSVPVRLIGRQVRVLLHASEVVVYDGRAESPGTSVWPPGAGAVWTWTTTWKDCCASPALCPGPLRWTRPGQRGSSPRYTTPGGRPRAVRTATRPAPAR